MDSDTATARAGGGQGSRRPGPYLPRLAISITVADGTADLRVIGATVRDTAVTVTGCSTGPSALARPPPTAATSAG